MDKSRGGHVCAAKNCNVKSYASRKSFFRFPKDPVRARIWLLNSRREDLLDVNIGRLHQSYRLCSIHFELEMFSNINCNRLKYNAVPTIFRSLEGSSKYDHSYSCWEPVILEKLEVSSIMFEVTESDLVPQRMASHENTIFSSLEGSSENDHSYCSWEPVILENPEISSIKIEVTENDLVAQSDTELNSTGMTSHENTIFSSLEGSSENDHSYYSREPVILEKPEVSSIKIEVTENDLVTQRITIDENTIVRSLEGSPKNDHPYSSWESVNLEEPDDSFIKIEVTENDLITQSDTQLNSTGIDENTILRSLEESSKNHRPYCSWEPVSLEKPEVSSIKIEVTENDLVTQNGDEQTNLNN